jgi:hypothetical protein
MNIGNATIKIVQPWYMIVVYSLIGVCAAGTVAFGVLIVLHFIKRKKVQQ